MFRISTISRLFGFNGNKYISDSSSRQQYCRHKSNGFLNHWQDVLQKHKQAWVILLNHNNTEWCSYQHWYRTYTLLARDCAHQKCK